MSNTITREQLYNGFRLATENLENNLDLLNSINVFPVPDQDTGSNMSRSMSESFQLITEELPCIDMVERISHGLLHNGKGNSGTILALFFQGFAKSLRANADPELGDTITGRSLAKGFVAGAANAYAGVANPMDGTILTISQKAGEEGMEYGSHNAAETMTRMTEEAYSVLPLTSVLNPVLAEYNVIDSGALGFCMIMDGLDAAFNGRDSVTRDYGFVDSLKTQVKPPELTYQYCTEFVISKSPSLTPDILKRQLADLGDCIVPVESDDDLKMHIHTNKPDAVFFIASLCGPIKRTKVDNMMLQSSGANKPISIYLCKEQLTYDGLLSMELDNVFIDSERDKFAKTVETLIDSGSKIRVYTSRVITGPLADKIPVIRFFTDDNDLLNFVFSQD